MEVPSSAASFLNLAEESSVEFEGDIGFHVSRNYTQDHSNWCSRHQSKGVTA